MLRRFVLSPACRSIALAAGTALLLTTPSSAEKIASTQGATDQIASPDQPSKSESAKKSSKSKTKKVTRSKARTNKIAAISNPKFDPKADHVRLFDGIEKGTLNVRVVARDSFGGNLFVENRTQQPLTVEMAPFVGVQVLRQFGGGGMGAGGRGGAGGMMGGMQAMGGGMGMGMGMGGMGGMGMGGMGMGGGMFSVPAEKVVRVPYHSVCLEHGKSDPDPTVHYRLIPVNKYTKNDQLVALITLIANQPIDQQVAQAAAWHLSSQMTWEELANKPSTEIGASDYPYFSREALFRAQELVAQARGLAVEQARKPEKEAEIQKDEPSKGDHVIRGR